MIQFNLLPDIKMEYIKARRQKQTVLVVSSLVALASLAIFILLFVTVHVFQRVHLNDLNTDIKSSTKELKAKPDLNKVLTIQNQISSLDQLHNSKPVTSRLFGYLGQVTPAQVSIGKIDVDFTANTMAITGSADSIGTANKFIDTLKFTTYSVGGVAANTVTDPKPFTAVVLGTFSRDDKGSTFQVTLNFDPLIFDSSSAVVLTVPKIISTRSEVEKPTDLFKALPDTTKKVTQ